MNHIEEIRADIQKYFDPEKIIEGSNETFYSPDKKYRIETVDYLQSDPNRNWSVKRVEIFYEITGASILHFYLNDDYFFHSWVTKDGVHYLICAEDLCGGQTIVDLNNSKVFGFTTNDDGFIWTEHYLSPDGKHLAAIGCYWACPTIMKIYNFENPTRLPLDEISEWLLFKTEETFAGWVNGNQIELSNKDGVKRVIEIVKE